MRKIILQGFYSNSRIPMIPLQQKLGAKQQSNLERVTCECWGPVGCNPTWPRFWQILRILWDEAHIGACNEVHFEELNIPHGVIKASGWL